MNRPLFLCLLIVALASAAPLAHAGALDDVRSSIASLWGQKARKQGGARAALAQATHNKQKALALHERLEATQQMLEVASERYENYFAQMRRTEAKIVASRRQLRAATLRYQKHKKRFGARLATLQEHGTPSFLPLALGAKSFTELSQRAATFKILVRYDANLQADLKADRAELAQAHRALMAQWGERNALQLEANRERERIAGAQTHQVAMWRQLNSSRAALLQYAAAQQQSSRELTGLIGDLEARRGQIIAVYEVRQAQARQSRGRRGAGRRARFSARGGWNRTTILDAGADFSGSGWAIPARGRLSSRFGMRYHPILRRYKLHTGDDIAAPQGSPIRAARGGRVLWAGWKKAYGNTIIVDVGGGKTVLYGHASRVGVQAGQPVKAGQTIGSVGSTGWSTGPHLHFEVRQNGRPVNPRSALHRH